MISTILLILYLVSLLVLDLTAIIESHSHSSSSIKESLELAYSQGRESGLFSRVKEIFPEPHQAYSLEQYDVFISHNRLGMSHFFTRINFLLIELVFL
jgi:hypothetical protein